VSEPYALLVVGGGAAGLSAARSYRELDGRGRVAIVTDEHLIPYQRPPLTKDLLRGESRTAGLSNEPEEGFDQNRVELIGGRAVALDADERTLTLSGGRVLEYGHCLLSTGAEPKASQTAAGDTEEWDAVPGFWSTIGTQTLKYAGWGHGFDQTAFERHADGGFTARYGADGKLVGVLTHNADDDDERAHDEIAGGTPWIA
jgi:hypothetical protein